MNNMNIEISPKEYERRLNWYDAMMYCQLLVIDGKDDWRLPTKEELDYICHSENDFVGSYYWSSTDDGGSYAWGQFLPDGIQLHGRKNLIHCVHPVRSSTI
jgi:formylglycine-generating enzyme required for sulfatase activity